MDYFKRVACYSPTRFWVNNVTRAEAALGVAAGATGSTQNPAFISKIIKSESDGEYVKALFDKYLTQESDDDTAITHLQVELVKNICEIFMPVYKDSSGEFGYVSIQANPFKEDHETIMESARLARAAAPNVIIKVPVTKDGLLAIRDLIKQRIPVLATEVMCMDQMIEVCEVHREATAGLANPAPFHVAHITGIFDEHLIETARKENIDIAYDVLYHGSFALARRMTQYIRDNRHKVHYMAGGARGLHHFTDMVGVDGNITINWAGTADELVKADLPFVDRFSADIPYAITDELFEKMPDFRNAITPGSITSDEYENFGPVVRFRNSFERGWQAVRDYASSRRKELK